MFHRLPAANDSRRRDTTNVRNRLCPDYLEGVEYRAGSPLTTFHSGYSSLWGCPLTTGYGWNEGRHECSWFWNAGWGSGLDIDGHSVGTPSRYGGNPSSWSPPCSWADGFDIYLTGRGFNTSRSPDEIVILCDGYMPDMWNGGAGGPWGNHADSAGEIQDTSNSLVLSGRVVTRHPEQLRYAGDGGTPFWF